VTVLETKAITTYGSIRKAAEALNSDIKAILYNEKTQKPALFFYLPPFSPPLYVGGGKEGGQKIKGRYILKIFRQPLPFPLYISEYKSLSGAVPS
jgi:hypothetical protein